MSYVDIETIKKFAEAPDADLDAVWEILAASASLIFDRACGVSEGFFNAASDTPSTKVLRAAGTPYLQLPPYVTGSLTLVEWLDFNGVGTAFETTDYFEQDGFLIFGNPEYANISLYQVWTNTRQKIRVTAKWGFETVPADVKQAVIEQAIFMWRRKDAAFTEMSGVATAAVQQQLSSTCAQVAEKYRQMYLDISV